MMTPQRIISLICALALVMGTVATSSTPDVTGAGTAGRKVVLAAGMFGRTSLADEVDQLGNDNEEVGVEDTGLTPAWVVLANMVFDVVDAVADVTPAAVHQLIDGLTYISECVGQDAELAAETAEES